MIPGCGSLSEIAKAEEMGCEFIKLFLAMYMAQILLNLSKPQPWALSCRLEEFQLRNPIYWDGLGGADCRIRFSINFKEVLINQTLKLEKNVLDTIQFIQK